jgi:exodeoxyribonuclease-3
MKIITYNVNGIRSALGKGFLDWLQAAQPDVVCLQEIKAHADQIPMLEFEALGYRGYWFPAKKKGYSGVGILTRIEPDSVVYGMGIQAYDDEGRFLRVDFGDISVVSVYHPSGTTGEERQDFKMIWLEDFLGYVMELRQSRPHLILSGDYNICHKPIDIHDPVRNAKNSGFLPEEREWITKFLYHGFVDTFRVFNQSAHQYTWWSFRSGARQRNLGWRIDYNMVTEELRERLKNAYLLPEAYHSDHCPCVLEIDV